MSPHWTAEEIPDQHGRRAVVTGANSGLGRVMAVELARHGAQVVPATRNLDAGTALAKKIEKLPHTHPPMVTHLDLASLASIRRAAEELGTLPVDLLINNAGVMMTAPRTTSDGFELQFGTNHLGHFAITGLLLDSINRARAGRIVTVSSNEHKSGRIDLTDLGFERHYTPRAAYQRSKLANALFARELDRRLRQAESSAISVSAHPGYAATNLQRSGPTGAIRAILVVTNALVAQTAQRGALPILYAGTAPDVGGGDYYGPDGWREMRGFPTRVRAAATAYDPTLARQLWEASEQLTAVRYDMRCDSETERGSG